MSLFALALVTSVVAGQASTDAQDSTVLITTTTEACSGSLIAPNLVVTARHCVSNMSETGGCVGTVTSNVKPSSLSISTGKALTADKPQPVTVGMKLFVPSDADTCGNDIAFIQLAKDIDAPIAKLRFTKPTAGETVMVVGYGEDGTGALTPSRFQRTGMKVLAVGPQTLAYKKKTGTSESVDVPSGEIATSEGACHGDSGGPLLDAKGNLIGVVSRGGLQEDTCLDTPDLFTATWSQEKRIRDVLGAVGHPLPDPPPTTDTNPSDDTGDDDDDTGDLVPTQDSTKKKKPTSGDDDDDDTASPSTAIPSSGCAASSRRPNGTPAIVLLFVAGFVYLARKRRLKTQTPASRRARRRTRSAS